MIDLHCHLLPGVDDGSASLRVSLRLAREAVENGIEYALLTPHHMNGVFVNHKQDVIEKTQAFQAELDAADIALTVFPGQEVRINGNLLKALDEDDILFADEDGRYLMLEFPDDDVPNYTSEMIFEIEQRGIIPVIVHPERNTKIMKYPEILLRLLEKGCLTQITASSYVGTFGDKVKNFSHQLIEAQQGYVFSSDAHDLPNRSYEMQQAFELLEKEFGNDIRQEFEDNAKAMINGDDIAPHQPCPVQLKKKKRFGLF